MNARHAWLIDGDDPALVASELRRITDELVGDADRTLVVEDFGGDDVDLAAVADACRTPPFLADRRVVIVRDVGRFGAEEVAPLVAYLADPLPSTALVLAAGAGRVATRLAAAVKAAGHVVSTEVSPRNAQGWVRQRVQRSGLRLDADASALVAAHLGEEMGRLPVLLDVLTAAYGEQAQLGPADVEPYLGQAGGVAPWDLTDAIDAGENEAALIALHRLLEGGERHPLVVLATLARHVQAWLRVENPAIATEAAAADALGIAKGRSTFPAKKAWNVSRRIGPAAVADAIGLVADAELALKGAQEWPAELVLEVLVARLCRLARTGRPRASGRPAVRSGSRVSRRA